MPSIAVVGFGRIGRVAVRSGLAGKLFTPSVIVDVAAPESMAPLFEVDSNYGRWPEAVRAESDALVIGDAKITWIDARTATADWKALGVDLVLDCTGRATTRAGAQAHLDAGASRVLVSAPSKTLDDPIGLVRHRRYRPILRLEDGEADGRVVREDGAGPAARTERADRGQRQHLCL